MKPLREAWIVFRDDRAIGVALDKRVADQAVLNSRRYDLVNSPGKHDYLVLRSSVMTQRFVAPKGYAKENNERREGEVTQTC